MYINFEVFKFADDYYFIWATGCILEEIRCSVNDDVFTVIKLYIDKLDKESKEYIKPSVGYAITLHTLNNLLIT